MITNRASYDQFRILFEGAPNGVMAVDAAGCIIQLNAQVEKMFGYSREELIGQSVDVLLPARVREKHAGLRKKFAAAPQMRPMGTGRDLFAARKDGSEFPAEIGLNPTATGLGNVIVATIVDISERKQAAEENQLYDNARRKTKVCQQLGMPAAVLRQDGRIVLMNALFKALNSQFVLKGDRIEVADPAENALFMKELKWQPSSLKLKGCRDFSVGLRIGSMKLAWQKRASYNSATGRFRTVNRLSNY